MSRRIDTEPIASCAWMNRLTHTEVDKSHADRPPDCQRTMARKRILAREGQLNALIIDPGTNAGAFRSLIEQRACRPCAILNTHAHYDHIGSVSALMEAYDIPFYLHKDDAALLRQANIYRVMFGEVEALRVPSKFSDLSEANGSLEIGGFDIEIL